MVDCNRSLNKSINRSFILSRVRVNVALLLSQIYAAWVEVDLISVVDVRHR
jgi:hypothetical protein